MGVTGLVLMLNISTGLVPQLNPAKGLRRLPMRFMVIKEPWWKVKLMKIEKNISYDLPFITMVAIDILVQCRLYLAIMLLQGADKQS